MYLNIVPVLFVAHICVQVTKCLQASLVVQMLQYATKAQVVI